MKKVLSLDPSYRNIGYIVYKVNEDIYNPVKWEIIDTNVIKTNIKGEKNDIKFDIENQEMENIIENIENLLNKHYIDTVILERVQGSQSARANRLLGYIRGIIETIRFFNSDVNFHYISPQESKKCIYPNEKKVDKKMIIEWVTQNNPGLIKTLDSRDDINKGSYEHITDSYILLYTFLTKEKIKNENKNTNTTE